ncbi:RidA family protein [Herbaspirillum sp. LeCh32-8]|uniref:RidA family protein n=1 Tax=Herbaspirillum sp. LeCh32-8 TaxID=2821356 RepID=UPI001AE248D4|nr:RidA family protein [Herbaspirillum sp. LeCh32-8]MBP0598836.1 RidA family protein [Herbaspirillum sp. LeCh32-8]
MTKHVTYVNPEGAAPAQGLYSHATKVEGGTLFYIAGQLAVAADGSVAGKNDFKAQFKQVFDNLGDVLKGMGLTFKDIAKFNTYLVHSQDIDSFMKLRAELFPKLWEDGVFPPNTLLVVDRMVKEDFLLEVEAVAVKA